jgi:hypothetical protein
MKTTLNIDSINCLAREDGLEVTRLVCFVDLAKKDCQDLMTKTQKWQIDIELPLL